MLIPCTPGLPRQGSLFGRTRYHVTCTACGVHCSGWTPDEARAQYDRHAAIPAPPSEVLAAPLTAAIVAEHPAFYIIGPGHQLAAVIDCEHGYRLTASCPSCP